MFTLLPEFEGREARVYVSNGVAIRRLKCAADRTRMKAAHALLACCRYAAPRRLCMERAFAAARCRVERRARL